LVCLVWSFWQRPACPRGRISEDPPSTLIGTLREGQQSPPGKYPAGSAAGCVVGPAARGSDFGGRPFRAVCRRGSPRNHAARAAPAPPTARTGLGGVLLLPRAALAEEGVGRFGGVLLAHAAEEPALDGRGGGGRVGLAAQGVEEGADFGGGALHPLRQDELERRGRRRGHARLGHAPGLLALQVERGDGFAGAAVRRLDLPRHELAHLFAPTADQPPRFAERRFVDQLLEEPAKIVYGNIAPRRDPPGRYVRGAARLSATMSTGGWRTLEIVGATRVLRKKCPVRTVAAVFRGLTRAWLAEGDMGG
jgi:hypothetical protein